MADTEYLTVPHLSIKDITRIFQKIKVDPVSGCWNWMGRPTSYGYGQISYQGRTEQIHRLVFAWLCHKIPRIPKRGKRGNSFHELDHTCRNRLCINAAHLEFVSHKTNVLRGSANAAVNARMTHCKRGHLLPGSANWGDQRLCLVCRQQWSAVYRLKGYPYQRMDISARDEFRRKKREYNTRRKIRTAHSVAV